MPETVPQPAWTTSDLSDPHTAVDKPQRVRRMFAGIAGRYDLNNRIHSFGRDQAWRRVAVAMAAVAEGDQVVDVACGTGDLALAFANHRTRKASPRPGSVIGIDFTFEMLPLARAKSLTDGSDAAAAVTWIQGDATALPLADASADVISIAFGLRNVGEPRRALAEFARVLRPGGRLAVLEFSEPKNPLLRWGSNFYTRHIMPRTASWIARDRSGAYRYLPASVDTFWSPTEIAAAMKEVGFETMRHRRLTFGVATVTAGTRRGG